MRNEWLLTYQKRMTLTKEKTNTYKQRTSLDDERPFKVKQTWIVFQTDSKNWHSFLIIRRLMRHSCDRAFENGRSSSGDVRCLYVIFFSFVTVLRFWYVKSHSFIRRRMRHSCDRAFKDLTNAATSGPDNFFHNYLYLYLQVYTKRPLSFMRICSMWNCI